MEDDLSVKKTQKESSTKSEKAKSEIGEIRKHVQAEKQPTSKIPYARTGGTLLDLVVGGGVGLGFPFGKIVNIVGDKSSGKTFIANEIIARNKHDYKKKILWNYDDGESGYTFNTQQLYGIEIMTEDTLQSKTIEEFDVNTKRFLNRMDDGDMGIYVLDSLDGLSNEDIEARAVERFKAAENGKEYKKGTYGMKTPKFLSQDFFKTKTGQFTKKDALLIIISQVRENIDPYSFQKYSRSGGKALDFYAHTCLWLATVRKLDRSVDGENRIVGVLVKAKTDKSKTPRPFRECTFSLYFDYGVDNIGSNLDYLFDLRTKEDGRLKDSALSISWSGKTRNLESVKDFLESRGKLEQARAEKKEKTGKRELKLSWLNDWIAKDKKLSAEAETEFGICMTRDALIKQIESDPEMEKELERRVIEKWETIEQSLQSNRKRKYQ